MNGHEGQQSLGIDETRELWSRQEVEAEEWSRYILTNMNDLVYCCDLNGIGLFCSPSVTEWLGYRPEEVVGVKYTAWCQPDPEELGKLSRQLLRHRRATVEWRLRSKAGEEVWFEFAVRLNKDAPKGPMLLAVGRETTKRRQEASILAETMRMTRVGSWEWNVREGDIELFDQLYAIFGLEKQTDPPSGADILSKVHPVDRKRMVEAVNAALRSGQFDFECRFEIRREEYLYLHLRGIVTYDEEMNPVKMSGTVQDITDRKRVERELQETVERYNSLKKYNHDAVFSLDLDGRIINANAVAERLTGYKISDMAGKPFSEFIGEQPLSQILSESMQDASVAKGIDKIHTKYGHTSEVLTTVAPIMINKKNVGFYIIAKDITEQKQLLIAKEAAESTNRAKSEFLAMMSHEIRTPMNGVIGMTDLMLETTELTETQTEYLEIIRKSGDTLLAIINDILDFAKIESGKSELHEEMFDLRKLISETLDIVMVRAMEKGLSMDFNVSPDVPDRLFGDADRLRQVLLNLIGNAVKFTYTGGVTVTVRRMEQGPDVKLCFTVQDTGIGIPKEKIPLLFQPFSQLDHFMTRRFEGTGLGLAITKKLVDLMGGDIWVEPHDGPGATFVFCLALKQTEDQAGGVTGTLEEVPSGKKLNILIAEDNEINRIVLKKMLERLGHATREAANGLEVLQAVAYESFDMIFMDVHMPEMNGLEATRVIKSKLLPEKCPVIVAVTANALAGDRENCLSAGMDDYMSKPIKPAVVAKIIRKFF
ncbi:PAS domain S-box protein [Paenibacillus sp. alder61]|uniref:Circadian input-output histidine kinase CikA n=1 Tax=Paenibacillus faecis TaxID=862114 RepID=A0A5D0CNV3_9BACL|nr:MULTISPECIES: PAS domain S-box protein [Paenibacillus]MCA1294545.1 PAS domain S-box protein [Paenibacillus sp. alder61]TYA10327.1 PAS domain S-box protein [Paenibacillus faecis]